MFEYPVFQADIRPEGYFVVSLGDRIERRDARGLAVLPEGNARRAVAQTLATLISDRTARELDRNASIGRRHHHLSVLREFLAPALAALRGP